MSKTVILKLACAIALAGEIVPRGSLVEVTQGEARDLLRRGKAVVHNADPESGDKVIASGGTDPGLHPDLADYNADQAQKNAEAAAPADPEPVAGGGLSAGGEQNAAVAPDSATETPADARSPSQKPAPNRRGR